MIEDRFAQRLRHLLEVTTLLRACIDDLLSNLTKQLECLTEGTVPPGARRRPRSRSPRS